LACPGATGLEYGVAAEMFRRGVYGTPAPEARSGPGIDGLKQKNNSSTGIAITPELHHSMWMA